MSQQSKLADFSLKKEIMKLGRNLFYLILLVMIGAGAVMMFKKTPSTVANEQSMLGTSSSASMTDLQTQLVEAFNSNDGAAIAQLCDEEIQFTHGETDDFFSRQDVESYLKEMFKAMPTKKFEVIHTGSNQKGSGYYLIGNLETKDGKKLRVQVSNNKTTIQSIELNNPKDF